MKKICSIILLLAVTGGCASLPLQRAETYLTHLYRRIPYTSEGSYRLIDIFYATDREVAQDACGEPVFHKKFGKDMSYGEMNVKIDPRIKIGTMLPQRLKRHGMIGIQDIRQTEGDAFMEDLADAIAASPHQSLLVVVFGYKDDFEATAIKASYFAYLLDVNTPILLFDWPGDQPVSIGGYKKAQALATASGPRLADLLMQIERTVKPERLWIKASSLGCQVVCDAFEHMYTHEDMADIDTEVSHVLLAAPDVDRNEFDDHFKKELMALSDKLTVYVSSNDDALLMSGFINGHPRLGRQRLEKQEQHPEAKALLYLKSLEPDRITVIDVTPINESSYNHGYYLEDPEFFDDFYMRVFDTEPSANRRLYLFTYEDGTDYWVLEDSE